MDGSNVYISSDLKFAKVIQIFPAQVASGNREPADCMASSIVAPPTAQSIETAYVPGEGVAMGLLGMVLNLKNTSRDGLSPSSGAVETAEP